MAEARRLGRPVHTGPAEAARPSGSPPAARSLVRPGRQPARQQPAARTSGARPQGGREGAEAVVRERDPAPIDSLFTGPREGLWLALDEVQDPHNVGAIFRAAAFFGVRGIVMTDVRAASLTSVVYDVASGGVEAVPFAIETNLRHSLELAKRAGVWVLGTSEHATRDVSELPNDRPWLLVMGNEESGLRRLTLDTCDEVCRITPRGEAVTSLNVSVAAGILISTLARPAV